MTDMRQIIKGLPETTMNDEEEGERSPADGESKVGELTRVFAVGGSHVVKRWGPFQDAVQGFFLTAFMQSGCEFRLLRQSVLDKLL